MLLLFFALIRKFKFVIGFSPFLKLLLTLSQFQFSPKFTRIFVIHLLFRVIYLSCSFHSFRYNGVTIHSEVLPSTKEEFEEKLFGISRLPSNFHTSHLPLIPLHIFLLRRLCIVSMKWWRSNRVRAVWLQIPLVHSDFIAPAAEAGFLYHHARPEYVYMNQWLAADEVNKLPLDTNTSVGVGGFVMNDNGELLVVKEKFVTLFFSLYLRVLFPSFSYLRHWGKYAPWKLPGGMADPGEDIGVAAAREILEGT